MQLLPFDLRKRVKDAGHLLTLSARHWRQNNCPLIAAGLAYYAVISLLPLMMMGLALASWAWGPAAGQGRIAPALEGFTGPAIADSIEGWLENARHAGAGKATVFSTVILLWVGSLIFSHLQRALNMIWDVKARGGVRGELINRLMAFLMVLTIGLFFLFFVGANAALGALRHWVDPLAPFLSELPFWRLLNAAVSFGFLAAIYTLIYKLLPALKLAWRDVWVGAVFTSFLISVGVYFIGFYFSLVKFWGVFGAAASVVVVLIWVYFSSQIFLFGAEFTWAYAHSFGSKAMGTVEPPVLPKL